MPSTVIELTVNDATREILAAPGTTLLDTLRDTLGLTGAKRGCAQGACGSCTVLLGGVPTASCLVPVESLHGAQVRTIEGVGTAEELDEVQQAFLDGFAAQCGFCTPGMIMSAQALLAENPEPGADDVAEAISGNVCRCTGYAPIVRAVLEAAQRRRTAATTAEEAS